MRVGIALTIGAIATGIGKATRAVIDLLFASCDRNTGAVWGYDVDTLLTERQVLLTVPENIARISGGRLLSDETWSDAGQPAGETFNNQLKSPFTKCIAIGDSFTNGSSYTQFTEDDDLFAVISDAGVAGNTTTQMVARFQSDVLDTQSPVVIIQGGINDIVSSGADPNATMQANIVSMLDDTIAAGYSPILINIGPWSGNVSWSGAKQTWTETYNTWAESYAITNSIPFVDIYDLLRDGTAINATYDSGDGLHPNVTGYGLIGSELATIGSTVFAARVNTSNKLPTFLLNEDVAINVAVETRTPTAGAGWTLRGTCTTTQNLTGADGKANTGWAIGGLDISGANDMFAPTGTVVDALRYEPAFILQQISTAGVVKISDVWWGLGNGEWNIDLSLLKPYWEVVDRDHPSVTIISEFTSAGTSQGIFIRQVSGTGASSIGYFNHNVELGTQATSQIYSTATGTQRDADVTTIPLSLVTVDQGSVVIPFVPNAAGQVNKYLLSLYVDVTNYLDVYVNSTQVLAAYSNGATTSTAVFTYSHLLDIQSFAVVYWDAALNEIGISAATTEAAAKASVFGTNTFIGLASLPAAAGIGNRNALSQFDGLFDDPVYYSSKDSL